MCSTLKEAATAGKVWKVLFVRALCLVIAWQQYAAFISLVAYAIWPPTVAKRRHLMGKAKKTGYTQKPSCKVRREGSKRNFNNVIFKLSDSYCLLHAARAIPGRSHIWTTVRVSVVDSIIVLLSMREHSRGKMLFCPISFPKKYPAVTRSEVRAIPRSGPDTLNFIHEEKIEKLYFPSTVRIHHSPPTKQILKINTKKSKNTYSS